MPQFSAAAANYWGLITQAASQGLGAAEVSSAVSEAISISGAPPLSFSDYTDIAKMFGLAVSQRNAADAFAAGVDQSATLAAAGAEVSSVGLDSSMIANQINSAPLADQISAPNYVIRFGVLENPGTAEETQSFRQVALGDYLPSTVNEVMDLLNSITPDMGSEHGVSLALSGPVNIFSM